MSSRRETTESECLLVVKWSKEGKSLREIASLIGVTHGCVQKILQKYKKTGSVANIPGRVHKEILSTSLQRRGRSFTQTENVISVDRLKPTFKETEDPVPAQEKPARIANPASHRNSTVQTESTTRYGRRVKFRLLISSRQPPSTDSEGE
ncbi:uncharacterized protein TNCT_588421 [Trichonephila clavata]|uniref:Paired domain-containing protein n=1 Tax=Trichonephila clavata TaxID=2740835 RepID=A0A8X6LD73_TRICU|nr:uncharacterized protein TNCT_588421 [Trichonephila clavata]